MLIVDKLKGNLYTRIKKHMTKKMYHLYYRENREASQSKEEYEANLLRAYRHLDACRFKNKGWPCPTCPSCCFCKCRLSAACSSRNSDYQDIVITHLLYPFLLCLLVPPLLL